MVSYGVVVVFMKCKYMFGVMFNVRRVSANEIASILFRVKG